MTVEFLVVFLSREFIQMPKCDFNKVALQLWHECSPVNLLHISKTPLFESTSEWLLLLMFFIVKTENRSE